MARKITEKFEPKNIVLGLSYNKTRQLLLTLNKDSKGDLAWMLPGGKTDDLTPEAALIKEFQEEFKRLITIVGPIGPVIHTDTRGTIYASLFRVTVLGDLSTIVSNEPDNIVKVCYVSQYEVLGKKSFQGYPITPLTRKCIYSIRNIPPWNNTRAPGHTFIANS